MESESQSRRFCLSKSSSQESDSVKGGRSSLKVLNIKLIGLLTFSLN